MFPSVGPPQPGGNGLVILMFAGGVTVTGWAPAGAANAAAVSASTPITSAALRMETPFSSRLAALARRGRRAGRQITPALRGVLDRPERLAWRGSKLSGDQSQESRQEGGDHSAADLNHGALQGVDAGV